MATSRHGRNSRASDTHVPAVPTSRRRVPGVQQRRHGELEDFPGQGDHQGFFLYQNDAAAQETKSGDWAPLLNDTDGLFSTEVFHPPGMGDVKLWEPSRGYIDFQEADEWSQWVSTIGMVVNPNSNNQKFSARLAIYTDDGFGTFVIAFDFPTLSLSSGSGIDYEFGLTAAFPLLAGIPSSVARVEIKSSGVANVESTFWYFAQTGRP